MSPDQESAYNALAFVIPLLDERSLRWAITGGFACYVYGVPRKITDIDIDVEACRDSPAFDSLAAALAPFTTQPLEHFVDQNYDNYNLEATYGGQVIDICPMIDLKLFDKSSGTYLPFYSDGFPKIQTVDFFGLSLPLLSKELIIRNKEMLVWQRPSDLDDIAGLRALPSRN
jgi:hypothetical protein